MIEISPESYIVAIFAISVVAGIGWAKYFKSRRVAREARVLATLRLQGQVRAMEAWLASLKREQEFMNNDPRLSKPIRDLERLIDSTRKEFIYCG